jgi:hypothetical protein
MGSLSEFITGGGMWLAVPHGASSRSSVGDNKAK